MQDILESYSLIFEDSDSIPGDIRATLKGNSKIISGNRFRSKIEGFIIEDSVNNVTFPLDFPVLDTSKIMLGEVYKRFKNFYVNGQDVVLPWHYVVEFYGHDYTVHATRPISHRFPISKVDAIRLMKERDQEYMDSETEEFMIHRDNLDMREMVHILVIGDSTIDVYTTDIYRKIGQFIAGPLSRQNKISAMGNMHFLNMGHKFNKAAVLPFANQG